jgi:hypothetical protein
MICYPLLGQNGRLGNQLFQIAATYSHALDCNTEALFPAWEHDIIFQNKIKTYTTLPAIKNEYSEQHFYFDPIPKLPDLAIKGYFQTEKYFAKNKQNIIDLFTFRDELVNKIKIKYKDFLDNDPVGVQLRTYTHGAIDPRHIHCDIFEHQGYLEKAFKFYGKDRLYIVVTDNYSYTEPKLPKLDNIKLINSNSFYEDFILLTLCADNIVSASSFGWWGAYLNKNKNKKIVAPKKWFKITAEEDPWYDSRDIACDDWIQL